MCGIAGIIAPRSGVEPQAIYRLTAMQHHRGPDDHGYALFDAGDQCCWSGRNPIANLQNCTAALGHRRLSIIDLTETGHQPMSDASGRFWIVFNGEIYNYIELREPLKQAGCQFRGASDTEVILHAWLRWGDECVSRFNGMWAFAIWDNRDKKLFASRDRFGVKPFYYYHHAGRFIFASEIKAILAVLPPQQRQVNYPYVERFALHGLLNDRTETFFHSINQLLPAHTLTLQNNHLTTSRYWTVPMDSLIQADRALKDETEAVEEFNYLLADSIRLRFRSDVPVGISLSGGLDSAALIALARGPLDVNLLSFTVEYQEPEVAEGHYARQIAQLFQTEAFYHTPTPAEYTQFIERFCFYHDEPVPGPGPFSQWSVMRLARSRVKVLLDGQGGDELLGGYHHYFNYYLTSLFQRACRGGLPRFTLEDYLQAKQQIDRFLGHSPWRSWRTALAHLLQRRIPAGLRPWLHQLRPSPAVLQGVIQRQHCRNALAANLPWQPVFRDDLNDILYRELTRDNLPMLLQYNDRTSMSNSIESRVPFLDYRLVEFVLSLPFTLKIRGSSTKYLLRQAMRSRLPESIVDRQDKKGFATPYSHWLKGPLHDQIMDTLREQRFVQRGFWQPQPAQTLLQNHCRGRNDYSWEIWRIIELEQWMRIFLDDFDAVCDRHLDGRFPIIAP